MSQTYRNLTELPTPNGPATAGVVGSSGRLVVSPGDGAAYVDAANGRVTATSAATYTIDQLDGLVLATLAGGQTLTLPTAASVHPGWAIRIKKRGASGTTVIQRASTDTIDGSTSINVTVQNDLLVLISDGVSNWWRLNLTGTAAQQQLTVTTQAGTSFTVANTDGVTLASSTSSITATLPAATGNGGLILRFKKIGATGSMSVAAAGSDTIEGAGTINLVKQYGELSLVSDGTATWYVLSRTPASQAITNVSNTATLDIGVQLVNLSGTNTYVLTLPSSAGFQGRMLTLKKTGASGTITVTPASGTIDGAATKAISTQYTTLQTFSDGTNWFEVVNAVPA